MVAADKVGEVGRDASARVVFGKVADVAVLGRTGHDGEVGGIADGLEVPADDDEVDAVVPAAGAGGLCDGRVDGMESAMALGCRILASWRFKI